MRISRNAHPSGDERITIKGELVVATDPAIDPFTNGVSFKVVDRFSGLPVFHREVPGGAGDPGWSGQRPRWKFKDRDHALAAATAFADEFGSKWPKAVAKITDDLDQLLAFYDFPAEHWIHLKTSNPIESTFATVRLRTKVTKGPGSRAAGLAMAYKLIIAAQDRWRAINGPHLVALVRAGATFNKGVLIENPNEVAA